MNRRYDTKRFILATGFLAFVLCVFILLTACTNKAEAAIKTQYSQDIEIIDTIDLSSESSIKFFIDKDTGVEYVIVYYQTSVRTAAVSITPMYNADGLPKTMK